MDANLKARWVEALRSGKYKQAQNRLRTADGFCCLGVLCEISGEGVWHDDPDGFYFEMPKDETRKMLPPGGLRRKYEIADDFFGSVAEMNDGAATFPEIADYIEKNL